jgi:hypothetical protein
VVKVRLERVDGHGAVEAEVPREAWEAEEFSEDQLVRVFPRRIKVFTAPET